MNPNVSILVPVYNSDDSLNELVEQLLDVFKQRPESFEIVFVNDGSPNPKSWEVLCELQQKHPEVIRCFDLLRNFGRAAALLCGFNQVKGEYVIMMDDDLQHNPYDIPKLLEFKSFDLVIACFEEKKHGYFKRKMSDLKGWIESYLIGKPKDIKNSSFKLINHKIIDEICKMHISNPFISGLLFYFSRNIKNVPLVHGKRKYGETNFTSIKLIRQFSNLLINNSSFLLRVVSYLGICFSVFGFVLGMIYIYRYLFVGVNIRGWITLVLLNLITSGLILFSIGVFGEYFIRLLKLSEKRPSYAIRSRKETE